MRMFTAEGWRSVDDRDVLYVYRSKGQASRIITPATLCLSSGEEVNGQALRSDLASLEAKLDDFKACFDHRPENRRSRHRRF